MHRKIIAQGAGGCTVSLPISWVRERNLKPGDDVLLQSVDGGLLIGAPTGRRPSAIRISFLHEAEPFIRVALNNAYRKGHTRIEVAVKTKKQEAIVVRLAHTLLFGFEVVSQNANMIVLQMIAEPEAQNEDSVLSRIFFILSRSLELLTEAVQSGRFEQGHELKELTLSLDRDSNIYRRLLFQSRIQRNNAFSFWSIVRSLVIIQHSVSYAYSRFPKGASKESKLQFTMTKAIVLAIFDAFRRKNIDVLEHLHEQANALYHNTLLPKLGKEKDALALYYCADILRSSYLMISPMLGVLLQE